jgi:hypothetical protein
VIARSRRTTVSTKTSIGANPQLSIYGITARLASGLAERLGGKPPA